MNKYTTILLLVFIVSMASAQDAHFTQYYQTPAMINPSLTGTFNGLYRVGFNYRDQWRPVVGRPYASFVAGGDVKFTSIGREKTDIMAMGINFFSDRTKQYDFNTTQIALSGAYHKLLDKKTSQYLGIGIQGSISQRNLNYEYLTFQDQFNAIDGYTLVSSEVLPVNNFGFFDISLGVNYSISPTKTSALNIGGSMFHVFRPDISFYSKNDAPNGTEDLSFKLNRRFTAHASYSFGISEFNYLEPRVLYMVQGPYTEAVISNLFKYKVPGGEGRTFFAGPGFRMVNNEKSTSIESLLLMAGMEYNGLIFGVSYDQHLSDLSGSGRRFSTFEFSVNYLGDYDNSEAFCPTF